MGASRPVGPIHHHHESDPRSHREGLHRRSQAATAPTSDLLYGQKQELQMPKLQALRCGYLGSQGRSNRTDSQSNRPADGDELRRGKDQRRTRTAQSRCKRCPQRNVCSESTSTLHWQECLRESPAHYGERSRHWQRCWILRLGREQQGRDHVHFARQD